MSKNQVPRSKNVTCSAVTDRQTDTQTEVLTTENPIRASAIQASACDLHERSKNRAEYHSTR